MYIIQKLNSFREQKPVPIIPQLTRVVAVSAGVEPSMVAGTARPPAVVDHHEVSDGAVVVEPGQKLGTIPVGVRRLPVPVRPHHVRLVVIDNLVHLRQTHLLWVHTHTHVKHACVMTER